MREKKSKLIVVATVALLAVASLAANCGDDRKQTAEPVAAAERNPRWAQPLERPGLPNLNKVSNALYRGAQPEPEGFVELQKMGIKTVVNLRSIHSDRDDMAKAGLEKGALGYEHIRMTAWNPEHEEIVRFIRIMADPANHPVFVHCQHGADRTGLQCAVYRVAIQGWSKREALREMTEGGYGFHRIWVNLPTWFEDLPIEKLARQAGIDRRREQAR